MVPKRPKGLRKVRSIDGAPGSSAAATSSVSSAQHEAKALWGARAAAPCSSWRLFAEPSLCVQSFACGTRPFSARWSSQACSAYGEMPGIRRGPVSCSSTPRRLAAASRSSSRRASSSTASPPAGSRGGESVSGTPTPSRRRLRRGRRRPSRAPRLETRRSRSLNHLAAGRARRPSWTPQRGVPRRRLTARRAPPPAARAAPRAARRTARRRR
mmetsp:Transcript_91211/g.258284  ORF Transcript_91211/g.258284 Transcript_91211/m.258284 type:complete len:213 (-) Transcript_91211:811-1449(-)